MSAGDRVLLGGLMLVFGMHRVEAADRIAWVGWAWVLFGAVWVVMALAQCERKRQRRLRCLLGFHDWVRRGGVYVKPTDAAARMVQPPGHDRPMPTGYVTDRFEQCFRCNKTRKGWAYRHNLDAPKPPKPEPWP